MNFLIILIRKVKSLGISHLGKYPWEVAAWENTLGNLPFGKLHRYKSNFKSIVLEGGAAMFGTINKNGK